MLMPDRNTERERRLRLRAGKAKRVKRGGGCRWAVRLFAGSADERRGGIVVVNAKSLPNVSWMADACSNVRDEARWGCCRCGGSCW